MAAWQPRSWLSRQRAEPELACRLTPIVPRLSELLGTTVLKADDCIGDEVKQKTSQLQNGQVGR